jgi:ADP-heptose:LPS heptosyltransferase
VNRDPRLDRPPGLLVRAAARAAAWLLPLRGKPAALNRILVVRTDDRVGNALLTIPLVRALQAAFPKARVDLLLARPEVAEGLPGLSILRFNKRNPFALLRLLRSLRGYDAVIDAAHWHAFSLTSALLSRWATRRWLVGSDRGPSYLYSAALPPPPPGMPEVEAKLLLAAGLGLPALSAPPLETPLGRGPSPVAGSFVALNPGARKAGHRWGAAGFAALAGALRRRCVIFWGPGEEKLAREVAEASGAELAPPTDLDQLAAAFRAASLVVTNDTGPMHLAVACGAPVVAIFLDEAGLRWAHPGPRFAAVVAPPGVEPVLAAAARLLDTAQPPAEPARYPEGIS